MQSISSQNGLSTYLSQIGRYSLLDSEQEKQLARKYRKTRDPSIAHQLVNANLRFVVKVASEYRTYGLRPADLIQEGNLGLMKAVEKFDPRRGIRLISYAVWWIRAYIQNYILRSWSLVKLGTTQVQRRLFFSLARAKREIERLSGPDGSQERTEELARQLRAKPQEISEMEQRMSGRDVSLDTPVDEDGPPRMDLVPGGDQAADDQVSDAQVAKLLVDKVADSMSRLDARERYIIERRVLDDSPVTFKDLGEHFGVSRERARQLELRAKDKLRGLLEKSLGAIDGAEVLEQFARAA